jgi:MarR family transcriptional regulator, organic hydroperoxide resistance regulator
MIYLVCTRKPIVMEHDYPGSQLYLDLEMALRSVGDIYQAAFEPYDVGVIEAYILRVLYEEDGQRASRLARSVGRAPTSFTPILDKIEAKGLIERRSDKADRRAIKVQLTERGSKLRKPIQAAFEQADREAEALIPADLLPSFETMLLRIHNLSKPSRVDASV